MLTPGLLSAASWPSVARTSPFRRRTRVRLPPPPSHKPAHTSGCGLLALAHRRRVWYRPDLPKQSQSVLFAALIDDLAAFDAVDCDPGPADPSARWRNAHQVTQVGTAQRPRGNDEIAFSDQ